MLWFGEKLVHILKRREGILSPRASFSIPLLSNMNTEKILYAGEFKRMLNSLSSCVVVLASGYSFLCVT